MQIDRISKIKGHRIFHEFIWDDDLLDFKEKNLFYGWNGTGKSTFCNLFRSIEKGTAISEGEVEFIIAGTNIDGAGIPNIKKLPQVRVFNENFVADNVFTSDGAVAPIFFWGEEDIEKQKQVEKLKTDRERFEEERREKEDKKKEHERVLEDFTKERAKSIKDLLSSSGGNNSYNNYNKSSYQEKCEELLKLSDAEQKEKIMDELLFNSKKIEATSLDKLQFIKCSDPDIQGLNKQVVTLLKKTVSSSVIETLKNNPELSGWVKDGLEKHKKNCSNDCLFCGQRLPDGRIQELEGHFNDEYNAFIEEIERQSANVKSAIDDLESCTLPKERELYSDINIEFKDRCQEFNNEVDRVKKYLEALFSALKDKAQKPFQSIERIFDTIDSNITNVIYNLNAVIDKHNKETDDFQSAISAARTEIEESLVAKSLEEYLQKKNAVKEVEDAIKTDLDKDTELSTEIDKIKKHIEEHRRPADELNKDICSYLGRNELTFEIHGHGYQICRNGIPAMNLSEGERTAIAFLYFLKSLGDKSFVLKDGVVVIDDPVSSLDSNALFHAFAFMKERTKDAGQLFILTHNYPFFKQIKNWFNHLQNQNKNNVKAKPGRFYMLTNNIIDGNRSSSIMKLDDLLHKYESEYHYLFSLVYEAANSKKTDWQQSYCLPNIARRLLESFLAFRQPLNSGKLRQQLDSINFDNEKNPYS